MARRSRSAEENRECLRPAHAAHKLYCPRCKHIFTLKDMWTAISRDFDSVWVIMEKLNVGWNVVRRSVEKWGLPLRVRSTPSRAFYGRVAKKCGYWGFEDMLYDLRVTKRMSYRRIAWVLGMDDWQVAKEACELLNPAKRKEVLKRREYFGYGRVGRRFSKGEAELIPEVLCQERKSKGMGGGE